MRKIEKADQIIGDLGILLKICPQKGLEGSLWDEN